MAIAARIFSPPRSRLCAECTGFNGSAAWYGGNPTDGNQSYYLIDSSPTSTTSLIALFRCRSCSVPRCLRRTISSSSRMCWYVLRILCALPRTRQNALIQSLVHIIVIAKEAFATRMIQMANMLGARYVAVPPLLTCLEAHISMVGRLNAVIRPKQIQLRDSSETSHHVSP